MRYDTKEGIAFLLKGLELVARLAAMVLHVRLYTSAWKAGGVQKGRVKKLLLLSLVFSFLSAASELLRDSESYRVPSWAREFYNSLEIKRSR